MNPPTDIQKTVITTIVTKLAALGHVVTWHEPISSGPLITTYRFLPKNSSRVAQIASLSSDIALALSVEDVMIQRIAGEAYIGVSVPNATRELVLWRNLLSPPPSAVAIPLNFGVDQYGHPYIDDLVTLPHLLIAGSTGSGKSVFLRSIIASAMFWRSPSQLQFILSDTKLVELGIFTGASHMTFLEPATSALATCERMDWLIEETERRLRLFETEKVHNLHEHNQRFGHQLRSLIPYIVLIIDEVADIFPEDDRAQSKISSAKLGKIVQKSRASGIHVIAATQRPSVNIVSGSIKSNFPARISFRLPSETDSRTVLGSGGAEHLLSRGDMFFSSPSRPSLLRLHSAFATDDDIKYCIDAVGMMNRSKQHVLD